MSSTPKWESDFFEDTAIAEIHFARLYVKSFKHGTLNHNALVIIERLADIIDRMEQYGMVIKTIYENTSKEEKDIPNET